MKNTSAPAVLFSASAALRPRRSSKHATRLTLALVGAWLLPGRPIHAADATPITPTAPIVLFNGKDHKDLSPFYTWLAKYGHQDTDRVFTVVDQIDGAPAIRISGQHWGGITTHSNYANYKLVVEFRWGLVTWDPRATRARDSGILLHGQGRDGNAAKDFKSPWMRSVEYQIIEGGTGDIILVGGYEPGSAQPIAPKVTATAQPGKKIWDPAGTPTEFTRVRIDWQHRDLGWKDVLGFRGAKDVEKPAGEWNRIEAIVDGGNLTYFLNGVKVNEVRDSSLKSGKLLFQAEGAEIYFRLIELYPLKK
ncbi:MAG: DUF1080 domain-containing protein [Opitutaceae bacterium]|nr:DUF1080 domain-containing protein [Opitutaceae bacterium]